MWLLTIETKMIAKISVGYIELRFYDEVLIKLPENMKCVNSRFISKRLENFVMKALLKAEIFTFKTIKIRFLNFK